MISYRGIIYSAMGNMFTTIKSYRGEPMQCDGSRSSAFLRLVSDSRTRVINHACPISGLSLLRHAVKPDNRPVLHISRLPFRASDAQQRYDDILINCMTRTRVAMCPRRVIR